MWGWRQGREGDKNKGLEPQRDDRQPKARELFFPPTTGGTPERVACVCTAPIACVDLRGRGERETEEGEEGERERGGRGADGSDPHRRLLSAVGGEGGRGGSRLTGENILL